MGLSRQGRKGHFPEPDKDPVIQIANLVTVQGAKTPCIKNVLTLNTCAPIVGAEVRITSFNPAPSRASGNWQRVLQHPALQLLEKCCFWFRSGVSLKGRAARVRRLFPN
jgi:hypothetical protein